MKNCRLLLGLLAFSHAAQAADFHFAGRSGDAIEIDLASLPGVTPGAAFSSVSGAFGHNLLTSDDLGQGAFATEGRFWVFPNPALNTPPDGDANPDARGFQGKLSGSVLINGVSKTFEVTVQPGHTGLGAGAVQQNFERLGGSGNNPLYVAQQQQRLRYLGFRQEGGAVVPLSGLFDARTNEALQTLQAAFDGGVNATQDNATEADGIVGPNTAGWLNAANAPTWDELIDPDPQTPGAFSLNGMLGDFDLLPGRDPGTNLRTGLTPQSERFGTNWAIEVFVEGSKLAKQATGVTQLMNGISTEDGYGSAAYHSSHRVGMDVDVHVDSSTWDQGNGSIDAQEQEVIDHAMAFINAPGASGVARILASNLDIVNGVNALAPGVAVYDSSGGHLNHLHIDIAVPDQEAGLANLPGDFNLDDLVDAADYVWWRRGLGVTHTEADLADWRSNYGLTRTPEPVRIVIPEPAAFASAITTVLAAAARRTASE